ncbi:SCO6880 family protein [Frankia sp. Cj3]|uniref:SCO6880 family protein n=1 Tax=Frankia sp. Cj3 TaxID=2880976 RepID=UPI001EF6DE5E|nr:SCO6880 family protein [Frankia sp. Cj3]
MSGSRLPVYRLVDRQAGGVLFGLTVPQLLLVATGLGAVVVSVSTHSPRGLATGLGVAGGCAALAFVPAGGRRLHAALPDAVVFAVHRLTGRHRWLAPLPLPLLTGSPAHARTKRQSAAALPRCLAGMDIAAVPRPAWADGDRRLDPVGLVRDERSGTWTAILAVRGGSFSLLDPADQHQRLAGWAQLLSQFARESSPLVRLGWSLWSAPAPLSEHLSWLDERTAEHSPMSSFNDARIRSSALDAAEAAYRQLLDEQATHLHRHDLRVWITLDRRRIGRRMGTPPDATLAAARALTDRARAAGLVVSAPLSPVEIAEAMRVQADPSVVATLAHVRRGLAEHAGMSSVLATTHAGPLSMEIRWTAVRVDSTWHRVFWVARWPALGLEPDWLDPLLLHAPCVRAVTVVLEPVSLRASRRRINAESVTIDGQVAIRERHAFRVPVHLTRAHAQVDQRETELAAGFPEYGYLALIDVAAPSREELDEASNTMIDLAAQCGVTELRPLHGRHDAAFAAALPLGRAPGQALLEGRA